MPQTELLGVLGAGAARPGLGRLIERAHYYLERSFLPGGTFSGPGDFTHQFQRWLQVVNARRRRVLGCAPTDRIDADRQAMLTLTGASAGGVARLHPVGTGSLHPV